MSDVSDGSGQVARRSPRASDGGAPISGALAIALAVIAVVAGFFILRSISGDDSAGSGFDVRPTGDDGANEATTGDGAGAGTATTLPVVPGPTTPTQPTTPTITTAGATVVVANANGGSGTAGTMSTALGTAGFTMGDPTDSALDAPIDASLIYFDPNQPAAAGVAASVNLVLGGDLAVSPLPGGTPPIRGELNGAGVLLMLGTDKAGRTLAELNPTLGGGVTQITNAPAPTTTAAGG